MRRIRGAAANVGVFANTALVNKADVCVSKRALQSESLKAMFKGAWMKCWKEESAGSV